MLKIQDKKLITDNTNNGMPPLLNKLIESANFNGNRQPNGHRFDSSLQKFSSYFRMLAGPLAYETIQKNLFGALPSISTTNRYIRKSHCQVREGVLRSNELLAYLKERNLPLVVSLSEDGSRIVDRVQYDSKSNQLIGFVLPIGENGMPITGTYEARNADEIMDHFTKDKPISSYVNIVMAQPIHTTAVSPFCLLLFGSDNKYSKYDVTNRWNYIVNELKKLGIKTLTISSDSDPKYNSTMRQLSMLGEKSNIFPNVDWFSCAFDYRNCPLMIQDTIHIMTKLRNFFLKTKFQPELLPFGKFFIQQSHLEFLIENFSKDQHLLTHSVLNTMDKQNFESVLRIIDEKVTTMLKSSVPNSTSTVKFLEIIRNIMEAYMIEDLSPLSRIQKIWYSVFMIRIWRNNIVNNENYSLKNFFLTIYTYVCIELNAHNIVLCMLHLKNANAPHLFFPHLLNSQQCEAAFRQLRSFTTVYSTVANCSVKEILGRISKIQFQNEIMNTTDYIFPRSAKSKNRSYHVVADLPTHQQIFDEIEKAKSHAFKDAQHIGLTKCKKIEKFDFSCKINPIKEHFSNKIQNHKGQPQKSMAKTYKHKIQCKSISLKNFASKFEGKVLRKILRTWKYSICR